MSKRLPAVRRQSALRVQIGYMRSSIAVLGRPTFLTRNSRFAGRSCPRRPGLDARALVVRPS